MAKGNLEHLQITDDILMALMDYPIEAFEIYYDPNTNEEHIRLKSAYRVRKNKMKAKKTKKKTKSKVVHSFRKIFHYSRLIFSNHHVGRDLDRRSRIIQR